MLIPIPIPNGVGVGIGIGIGGIVIVTFQPRTQGLTFKGVFGYLEIT